ncbi:MAG: OmpA family protein [Deltaproteobacteria bacterium]|nr:OmpA family protein [Deltaproteobacteria bacterium]
MRFFPLIFLIFSLMSVPVLAMEPVFEDDAQGILQGLLATDGKSGDASAMEVTVMERVQGEMVTRVITASPGQGVNILVEFDSGKATLRSASRAVLRELGQALASPDLQGRRVVLRGHTDADGPADMNRRLSLERAETVRSFLLSEAGLESNMIEVQGFGEEMPVAANDTLSGKQRNRRVEVVLVPLGDAGPESPGLGDALGVDDGGAIKW